MNNKTETKKESTEEKFNEKEKRKILHFSLSKKMAILLSFFSIILTISFGILSYLEDKDIIMKNYGEKAGQAAALVAYDIDAEKIKYYKKSKNMDDEYDGIVKNLDYVRTHLDLTYLYVIALLNDNSGIYIYDTSLIDDGVRNSTGYRQLLGAQTEQIENDLAKKILNSGENTTEIEIFYDRTWGTVATSYAPIKDKTGNVIALVGADIAVETILTRIYNSTFKTMAFGTLIALLCLILILYIISKTIIAPINIIEKATSDFSNNKDKDIKPIRVNNRDEIGQLAISFNEMMFDIKSHIENIKKITTEKEQVAAELSVANQIQESMLPNIFPAFPGHKEFDIYAKMIPAKVVGGDFYDFFLIGDNKLGFVISDVSGKGISAALFMVIAKILINNEAHNNKQPSEILSKVNKQLCVNNDAGMFATAFVGILSLDTGELNFANAGHTFPLVRRQNGEFEYLDMKKHFVLGGMTESKYVSEKIYLEKGDMMFLYTDGVTEAINSEKELFSQKRLKHTINKMDVNSMRIKEMILEIKKKVDEFAGSEPQADDITMMVIKFKKQNSNE